MYIFDIDSLRILDMNPSGLKALGYTINEVRQRDFFDLHAIEERTRAAEIIDIYRREGGIYHIRDLHLRRKDGSLIPAEKNGRITEVHGKPIGHWICHDLSGQVKAELEIRKRVGDLQALRTIAFDIASGRKKQDLFCTVISSAINLINCDAGGINLFDAEKQTSTIACAYNLPAELSGFSFKLDSDIFSMVIHNGVAQRADDYQTSPQLVKELADAGLRAVAAVPLRVRGKILGTLWVSMLQPEREFSDYAMTLLESIGAQAAVAIDNIDLFEEQRYISETLQRGFLPERLPKLKQTDIGIFYESATVAAVVGGDFYDAVQGIDDQVGLFAGDVSGKGIEATADAAMAKYTLRALSYHNPDPSSVLTTANTIISKQLSSGHFITLAYGLYSQTSGQLSLGVAGHPNPLFYSANTAKIEPVSVQDPAFAIIPDYKYKKVDLHLAPGDILALYTDGVVELRRNKEFFGVERLGELIAKYSGLKAQEIADNIIHDAREFAKNRLTDDIVLMIIKRTG